MQLWFCTPSFCVQSLGLKIYTIDPQEAVHNRLFPVAERYNHYIEWYEIIQPLLWGWQSLDSNSGCPPRNATVGTRWEVPDASSSSTFGSFLRCRSVIQITCFLLHVLPRLIPATNIISDCGLIFCPLESRGRNCHISIYVDLSYDKIECCCDFVCIRLCLLYISGNLVCARGKQNGSLLP